MLRVRKHCTFSVKLNHLVRIPSEYEGDNISNIDIHHEK